jgi:hypothetical protein
VKKKILIAVGIIAVILIIVGIIIYSKAVADPPNDDENTELMRFENVRGQRYTEILPIWGNGITKEFVAGVYNTLGLNSQTGTGDSSPKELLEKVTAEEVIEQNDALSALINGPRLWCLDWVEVKAGKVRDFNGLKAHWVMWFNVPKEMVGHEGTPYNPMTGTRNTNFGINAGSPAFILDDPEGNSWVMKSASLIIDPNQKYDDLQNLASRLKPASGWSFRWVILEQDLVLMSDNGNVRIVQDDLGNTYDRVGGPYSNYKP